MSFNQDVSMFLGMDFLLEHQVFIDFKRKLIYFPQKTAQSVKFEQASDAGLQ